MITSHPLIEINSIVPERGLRLSFAHHEDQILPDM
jgi:hypothetical protein